MSYSLNKYSHYLNCPFAKIRERFCENADKYMKIRMLQPKELYPIMAFLPNDTVRSSSDPIAVKVVFYLEKKRKRRLEKEML